MNPNDIKIVVDELFVLLENAISNPFLKMVVVSLQAIADGLLPQLSANIAVKLKKPE